MPLLPQTRSRFADARDIDDLEGRLDAFINEIGDIVDSAVEHMDVLRVCKDRLLKIQTQLKDLH